jgi:type IV/VI secretion system ImpK/VasF family protein
LFGSGGARRRRVRDDWDWDEAQYQDDYDEPSGQFTRSDWGRDDRRDEGTADRPSRRTRLTLMDLATPLFAYASLLPRDAGGMHPAYGQFRQEVMAALNRIETESAEHGIEREDAVDAIYALCLFLDGQVTSSEWNGKAQWANELLHIVKLQDPEGGINFFRRLDGLGDRRRAVKEICLVCLSLGFEGQYADLEPDQRATKLAEIRQRVLRSMHPTPLDAMDVLFPEAYEIAEPLVDDVPPPPRWWIGASVTILVVSVIAYGALVWAAGGLGDEPAKQLKAISTETAGR